MNARCGRQNVVHLILNAGFTPSDAASYVRWSVTKGGAVMDTGSFSFPAAWTSVSATPGTKLSVNSWIDLNGNGVQDAGEPARTIQVNVTR